MRLFKIGGTDYTRNIVVPSYTINRLPSYTEWEDGFLRTHRDVNRYNIGGSFAVDFMTKEAYLAFLNHLQTAREEDGAITCELYCNNENAVYTARCFIDVAPTGTLPLIGREKHDALNVTVMEV